MVSPRKPIMFVGPAGTGKTALVKGKLATQPEGIMSLNINFNYFTDVLSSSRRSLSRSWRRRQASTTDLQVRTSSSTSSMI